VGVAEHGFPEGPPRLLAGRPEYFIQGSADEARSDATSFKRTHPEFRFIENHDEPRAAAAFPDGKGRAAAVAILTLPGARLLHGDSSKDGR
jgi:hypothetical protein